MKNQRKFCVSGLVTAGLVAALIFGGVTLAAAQNNSAASGDHNRPGTIRSTPPTVTFNTLVTFDGTNGANPGLSPIQGTDGNLYGGTAGGGEYGQGVLFKMTPSGTLTVLYNFCAESGCPDGKGRSAGSVGFGREFLWVDGGRGTIATMAQSSSSLANMAHLTTLHSFDRTDGFAIKSAWSRQVTAIFTGPPPTAATLASVSVLAVEPSSK